MNGFVKKQTPIQVEGGDIYQNLMQKIRQKLSRVEKGVQLTESRHSKAVSGKQSMVEGTLKAMNLSMLTKLGGKRAHKAKPGFTGKLSSPRNIREQLQKHSTMERTLRDIESFRVKTPAPQRQGNSVPAFAKLMHRHDAEHTLLSLPSRDDTKTSFKKGFEALKKRIDNLPTRIRNSNATPSPPEVSPLDINLYKVKAEKLTTDRHGSVVKHRRQQEVKHHTVSGIEKRRLNML